MAAEDLAGLFGAAAEVEEERPAAKRPKVGDKERTDKLHRWDTVAAQAFLKLACCVAFVKTVGVLILTCAGEVLNPYGESELLKKLSTKKLWDCAAAPNKRVHFHTELAADTNNFLRVGIGISRLAATLLAAIMFLRGPVKHILDKKIYAAAMAEADVLEGHLKKLDFGKGRCARIMRLMVG